MRSVISISEPSMMEYFRGIPQFTVRKTRILEHQHFKMIQVFIEHPGTGTGLLLVDRLTAGDRDGADILAIFQEDHAGPIGQLAAEHLSTDGEHFAAHFRLTYTDENEPPAEVTYRMLDMQEFHGVTAVGDDGQVLSQAMYDTKDDENFYLAMVEWEGDWLSAWLGKELRKDQVALL